MKISKHSSVTIDNGNVEFGGFGFDSCGGPFSEKEALNLAIDYAIKVLESKRDEINKAGDK